MYHLIMWHGLGKGVFNVDGNKGVFNVDDVGYASAAADGITGLDGTGEMTTAQNSLDVLLEQNKDSVLSSIEVLVEEM